MFGFFHVPYFLKLCCKGLWLTAMIVAWCAFCLFSSLVRSVYICGVRVLVGHDLEGFSMAQVDFSCPDWLQGKAPGAQAVCLEVLRKRVGAPGSGFSLILNHKYNKEPPKTV